MSTQVCESGVKMGVPSGIWVCSRVSVITKCVCSCVCEWVGVCVSESELV